MSAPIFHQSLTLATRLEAFAPYIAETRWNLAGVESITLTGSIRHLPFRAAVQLGAMSIANRFDLIEP